MGEAVDVAQFRSVVAGGREQRERASGVHGLQLRPITNQEELGSCLGAEGSEPYQALFAPADDTESPLVDTFRTAHATRGENEGTATGRFRGTPASISARLAPHTVAIDEAPLDSVMSDSTRIV